MLSFNFDFFCSIDNSSIYLFRLFLSVNVKSLYFIVLKNHYRMVSKSCTNLFQLPICFRCVVAKITKRDEIVNFVTS